MSLTLTPIFDTSCAFPQFERHLNRDLASMVGLFEPSVMQIRAPAETVQQRQPQYLYEENDQQADLQVELPGVAKENVSVNIEANHLVISAKRFSTSAQRTVEEDVAKVSPNDNSNDKEVEPEQEKPEEPKPLVSYYLKLRIPRRYDTESITASMEGDGILKMVLPISKNKSNRAVTIH